MIVIPHTTSSLFFQQSSKFNTYRPIHKHHHRPPKILLKKATNKYKSTIYDDVDEDLYLFKYFGKRMTHSPKWIPRPRSVLLLWDETLNTPELLRNFRIDEEVDDSTRHLVLSIIKSN